MKLAKLWNKKANANEVKPGTRPSEVASGLFDNSTIKLEELGNKVDHLSSHLQGLHDAWCEYEAQTKALCQTRYKIVGLIRQCCQSSEVESDFQNMCEVDVTKGYDALHSSLLPDFLEQLVELSANDLQNCKDRRRECEEALVVMNKAMRKLDSTQKESQSGIDNTVSLYSAQQDAQHAHAEYTAAELALKYAVSDYEDARTVTVSSGMVHYTSATHMHATESSDMLKTAQKYRLKIVPQIGPMEAANQDKKLAHDREVSAMRSHNLSLQQRGLLNPVVYQDAREFFSDPPECQTLEGESVQMKIAHVVRLTEEKPIPGVLTITNYRIVFQAYGNIVRSRTNTAGAKADGRKHASSMSRSGFADVALPEGQGIKKGYLTKMGGVVQSWKTRYFVLSGNKLQYYKSHDDMSAKGCIVLRGHSKVEVDAKNNTFSVTPDAGHPKARRYIMSAKSEQERNEWMRAITEVIERLGEVEKSTSQEDNVCWNEDMAASLASLRTRGESNPLSAAAADFGGNFDGDFVLPPPVPEDEEVEDFPPMPEFENYPHSERRPTKAESGSRTGIDFVIPIMLISRVESSGGGKGILQWWCKDLRLFTLAFRHADTEIDRVLALLNPFLTSMFNIFAFKHHVALVASANCPADRGWGVYDPVKEFARMDVTTNPRYRFSDINKGNEFSPTYPEVLVVPASVTDEDLMAAANFRSNRRLPALCWRRNKTLTELRKAQSAKAKALGNYTPAIYRCSQPKVGLAQHRCLQDEQLLVAMAEACCVPSTWHKNLCVVDCRPKINAVGNMAKGFGWEGDNYTNCKIKFLDIDNIHVVRRSFENLKAQFRQLPPAFSATGEKKPVIPSERYAGVVKALRSAQGEKDWFKHIVSIIKGAWKVVQLLEERGFSVLVHCSDGWDRTPQITALAQILMDPYYRSSRGFCVLIEKEFLSFGHQFARRCGHHPDHLQDYMDHHRSPCFVQWMDCVYQLIVQYPTAFEFNGRFLGDILEHVHSCRYGTFLCDTEHQRKEMATNKRTRSLWSDLLNGPHREYYRGTHALTHGDEILTPKFGIHDLALFLPYYVRWDGHTEQPTSISVAQLRGLELDQVEYERMTTFIPQQTEQEEDPSVLTSNPLLAPGNEDDSDSDAGADEPSNSRGFASHASDVPAPGARRMPPPLPPPLPRAPSGPSN